MKKTRAIITLLAIAAFPATVTVAQDKPTAAPTKGTEALEALKKEYQNASKAWSSEFIAARNEAIKNDKLKDFKFAKPSPAPLYSPRFLVIAEKNPEGPEAIDALKLTLQTSYGATADTPLETRARAVKLLQDYYATKPQIKGVLSMLTRFEDEESRAVVAQVIAHNPDKKIQAAAIKGQIASRESIVQFADAMKDPKRAEAFANSQGKEALTARIAKAEKARAEIGELKQVLRESYSEFYTDLSIGKAAPEIVLQAVDGSDARLSSLKGNVVVLDIWATWCGPCKAMIPHEREMVERLKDKPFRLVGVSIDDEVKTLKDFLAKEKLPWTHWWAGPGGWQAAFAQDWDIRSIPAIFVLDAEGVIRYRNIRGEELEKAVNSLLAEKP